jgi:manganese transport protein
VAELTDVRVRVAASQALSGDKRGIRAMLPFLGPAFIAAVAYVDPGNFATNMAAGAQFGYALGWVVLSANLMAMLVQGLSAKLGIATGRALSCSSAGRPRARSRRARSSRSCRAARRCSRSPSSARP